MTASEIADQIFPGDGPIATEKRAGLAAKIQRYARTVTQNTLNKAADQLYIMQSYDGIQEDIKSTIIELP